jgi:RimJ/RimL family protein N-acetyltransferase
VSSVRKNEFGQPIGEPVDWSPRPEVTPVRLTGRTCRVEPLDDEHVAGLFEALCIRSAPSIWTYIAVGPFTEPDELAAWFRGLRTDPASVPHAIVLADGTPVGVASYLRLDARNGSVEVGGIVLAEELQRTTAATEAMYLMMRHPFEDLGYRRYEWKCDSLNAPSRRAAERLGFCYEGTFRNAVVYKGRNRDTDWLSITDAEWPAVRARLEAWLVPDNFDAEGRQRTPLQQLG